MLEFAAAGGASEAVGRSEARPALLCFSHLRWHFVYQRPQHLMSRAALIFDVTYVEEPLFDTVSRSLLDKRMDPSGVTVATPVLPHGTTVESACAAQELMLADLPALQAGGPRTTWYYSPMALPFSGRLQPTLCVYDCMDELSAFHGAPPGLKEREDELFAAADLVFAGGRSLYEAKRARHPDVHLFPSSIDAAHFAGARHAGRDEPSDQRGIPRPRLGFFGVIDERMDLALVSRAAELRPDWHFVFVGPVVKIDAGTLPRRANIHWLGAKSYAELPDYLAGWDVGLMPFARNEATRYISPTKTPEFLAAGVPVVSTPIADVVRSYGEAGLVEIAADPATVLERAATLMHRPKAAWLAAVDAHLATMSWDRTWSDMLALMERAGGRNARRGLSLSAA
jgi:hypothetical protein